MSLTRWPPWVGDAYCRGHRLLILGESHYETDWSRDEGDDLTKSVIRGQFATGRKPYPFHRRVQAMTQAEPDGTAEAFWHSVAFANLIPGLVPPGNKMRPTREQRREAEGRVVELIRKLLPSYLLLLGKSVTWYESPQGVPVKRLTGQDGDMGFGEVQLYTGPICSVRQAPTRHWCSRPPIPARATSGQKCGGR